jgi:hypothetical protein
LSFSRKARALNAARASLRATELFGTPTHVLTCATLPVQDFSSVADGKAKPFARFTWIDFYFVAQLPESDHFDSGLGKFVIHRSSSDKCGRLLLR